MYITKAYAATSATSPLAPTAIPRRDPGEHDVRIDILFCGICHAWLVICFAFAEHWPPRVWLMVVLGLLPSPSHHIPLPTR